MLSRYVLVLLAVFPNFPGTYPSYDISDKVLFPSLPNAAPRSENDVCREESQLYIGQLNNMTLWAHKMWDATAKATTGVLQGSLFHFGSFDECLKVEGPFRTQFCFATMEAIVPGHHAPADPFALKFNPTEHVLRNIYKSSDASKLPRNLVRLGWCVPASCTANDLEKSLREYLSKADLPFQEHNVTYKASVDQNTCQRASELYIIDSLDISFCILVAVLIILVLVGTAYDVHLDKLSEKEKNNRDSLAHNLILSFSAIQSYNDLSKADESNPALKVLYGIRTFSILMVIMDHRFGTFVSGPMENFDYIEQEYRSLAAWFIFHGDLFVDTFFILSGILVSYGLLNQFGKKYVHPGFIIFLRYMRLTPVYAFVIFFWATMFAHIGSGPFWRFVVPQDVADCRKNWWANILYISNYVDDDHMCMTHSWYLPCDFHYFIIGVFVIMLLNKNKKMGLIAIAGLFIVSLIIPFLITVIKLRPALLHFYPSFLVAPKLDTDFQLTYTKSHTRASSYFIGMTAGYIYYRLKDEEYHLSKLKSHLLTLISLLLILIGISSGAVFYNPYHEYNAIEAGTYAALHRVAWSLGTVGLLFTASYGHATFLYFVLTWSPWIPLSKLVYGAYLTHMLFQLRAVAVAANPRHFTYFEAISASLGDMMLAFATGLLLFIAIENPVRKITKHLLMPKRTDKHKTVVENSETETNTCNSRL